jgi:hypothetical protein
MNEQLVVIVLALLYAAFDWTIKWLAERRETEKRAAAQREQQYAPPPPPPIRRPQPQPPPVPASPPQWARDIPDEASSMEVIRQLTRQAEERKRRAAEVQRAAKPSVAAAAQRIAALKDQTRQPSVVTSVNRNRKYTKHIREPQAMRRAFVASLIFSPPKGLEP